ncbi:glucokinase [uncultured Roseovarius sp.]|uniref:glucokinase n=1 Tax=uncultured Roseovarius sp. TaxID=293344 RepID=UPI0026208681|nr:glucokinase [uncultured Roseovarius sp.]
MTERFLLADVGGTNTRVGLGGVDGLEPDSVQSFHNAGQGGLAPILSAYLDLHPGAVTALCAGVAGPVRDGNAQLTNLDWFIDANALQAATGAAAIHLINDLQAQGYALDDLPRDCITTIFPGAPPPPDATRLVMGLGTGCNIAVVHNTPQGLLVPASETGHSSLPHMEGTAGEFIAHLSQTQFHKPIEAAISGPGLSRIRRFLTGETVTPADIIAAYGTDSDAAADSLRLFAEILGTIAGNIALAHLPVGGFYFIGSTARAVVPYLGDLGFINHFTAKGPYTQIMQDIPVYLIDDDSAALHGCARYLRQRLSPSGNGMVTG